MPFETPVAFMIFNRPDCTKRVFEAIARIQPGTLLVVADGARSNRPGEEEQVAATRRIIDQVDWPCQVLKNYADVNLGCRRRMSSGVDWVFDTVEEAILLEDDCLPDPTFFSFCQELLKRYRHDERILSICGCNFQKGVSRTPYSYYFSKYPHLWGWASWRRAWRHYDVDMRSWPEFRDSGGLDSIFDSRAEQRFFTEMFDKSHRGLITSWCYQWDYTCRSQNTLSILPNVNLISNIGFDDRATHTTGNKSPFANLPTFPVKHLTHPPTMWQHKEADAFTFRHNYYPEIQWRQFRRGKRVLNRLGRLTVRTVGDFVRGVSLMTGQSWTRKSERV